MEKIWACEENFLLSYLSKRENLTPDLLAKIESGDRIEFKVPASKILSIEGDTATIEITGPLSRSGPDFIDMLFGHGGTSYRAIKEAAAEVGAMDEVKNVILEMDTPGGEVAGADATYDAIKSLALKKTVIARNNGMIASAGMWIACPANRIEAVEPTCFTGSIGVLVVSIDRTKMYEKAGVAVVEVVSKNAPDKNKKPTSKAGRDLMQERADAIERHFIARVAEGRGVSTEYVAENFGRGGIMIAQDPDPDKPDAISVGLIDGLVGGPRLTEVSAEQQDMDDDNLAAAHFEGLGMVAMVETPAVAGQTLAPSVEVGGENMEVQRMDLKQAMAEHPAIQAEVEKMVAEAREAGVTEGRAHVQSRVDKAAPYIGSEYPNAIQKLAASVIKGDEEPAALVGAVAMFDATKEAAVSGSAQADTDEAGETPAQSNHGGTGNVIPMNEDDFRAQLAAFKQANGIGGE